MACEGRTARRSSVGQDHETGVHGSWVCRVNRAEWKVCEKGVVGIGWMCNRGCGCSTLVKVDGGIEASNRRHLMKMQLGLEYSHAFVFLSVCRNQTLLCILTG